MNDNEPVSRSPIRRIDDDQQVDGISKSDEQQIICSVIWGADITEVYSPARVVAVAAKYGLRPGSSFDLTSGWNFSIEEHRTIFWKHISKEDPYCIIGSPPCTLSSMRQELTKA